MTQTGATLNATVNPNGGALSNCSFEYGATASYGSSAPCTPQPADGETPGLRHRRRLGPGRCHLLLLPRRRRQRGRVERRRTEVLTTLLPTILSPQEPISTGGSAGTQNQQPGGSTTQAPSEGPSSPPPAPRSHLVSTTLTAGATGLVRDGLTCPATGRGCEWKVTLETSTAIVVNAPLHGEKPHPQVVTLAHGTFAGAAGRTATIIMRLSSVARRLLARSGQLAARAIIAYEVEDTETLVQTLVRIRGSKQTHTQHSIDRRGGADVISEGGDLRDTPAPQRHFDPPPLPHTSSVSSALPRAGEQDDRSGRRCGVSDDRAGCDFPGAHERHRERSDRRAHGR